MKDVLYLSKLEFSKMFKTKIAKVGIILAFIIMIGVTISEYSDMKRVREYESANGTLESWDWREREEYLISQKESMLSDPYYNEIDRKQIERRVEIAEYRLEHNITKDYEKNMWWFFADNSFNWVFRFIILIVVLVGVFNVSSEYNNKTINMWLVSPYKRWKVLTSKYLAIIGYGAIILGIVLFMGLLSGIIIHGFDRVSSEAILYGVNGPYTISTALYSIVIVLLKLVELIFSISLAFMISVLLKSVSFATITSIVTIFVISPVVLYGGKMMNYLNYLPFNHLDFRKFLDFGTILPNVNNDFDSIIIQGFTPTIAALIIMVYISMFMSITYGVFCKRDVI